jgi:hypothetical protein
MRREDIIKAIDAYAEASGLSPTSICQYAVKDGRLYERLKKADVRDAERGKRLLSWMSKNPPERKKGAA